MNKSLGSVLLLCVFGSVSVNAFDRLMKWGRENYYRYMLGGKVYASVQQKKSAGQCEFLEKETFRRVIAEKGYERPIWLRMLMPVSPNESLFTYAQSVYRTVINVFGTIEVALKKDLPGVSLQFGDLKQSMEEYVLKAHTPLEDSEEFQEQIKRNVERAEQILIDYLTLVTTSTVDENVKKNLKEKINNGLETIRGAQDARLTWLERWHREKQLERLAYYVTTYCKK